MTVYREKQSAKNVRKRYVDEISKMLLGPGSEKINSNLEEEIISENPKSRYSTGILYPIVDKISDNDKSSFIEDSIEIEDKDEDSSINMDNSFLPSSIGLTFYCRTFLREIPITIKTAVYEDIKNPFLDIDSDSLKELFERISLSNVIDINQLFDFDLKNNKIRLADSSKNKDQLIGDFIKEISNLSLKSDLKFFIKKLQNINYRSSICYKRVPLTKEFKIPLVEGVKKQNIDFGNNRVITVYSKLNKLNTKEGPTYSITVVVKNSSNNYFFQTEIGLDSSDDLEFVGSEDIKNPSLKNMTQDDAMNLFLYRNKKTFAIGRGVSATWQTKIDGTISVKSSYLPSFELLPMSFQISEIDNNILQPSSYVNLKLEEQSKKINQFINAYDVWIRKIEIASKDLDYKYSDCIAENLHNCKLCSQRMKKTLEFIQNDNDAFRSFNLANESILLQRIKNRSEKTKYYDSKNYNRVDFSWRPFQFAFILLTLESIINRKSTDRDKLDLMWVSTGGGKTEAYLFDIAASILYRRMTKPTSEGVGIIMRYTLRLLTSQQFERATQLICALEFIRRNNTILGENEITIGLWIGESTRNRLKDAKGDFKSMVDSRTLKEALQKNTFQVLKCPWCNEEHSIIPNEESINIKSKWGYYAITKKGRSQNNGYNIECRNKNCEFHSGLPIYVVDESIYKIRPTLLFGTVDKFAQLPLNENAQKIFGSDDTDKYDRPDLIIQDELHLISGPLGSIVGLYEAGFDYIFKDNDKHYSPKYIASTATIKNAKEQVRSIFDRKVFQFPPNGIDIADNFFIREDKSRSGRLYLGVMPTGKSQVTVELRLIAVMLQMITEIGLTPEEEEYFWTVTGYFNSIRELGKAAGLLRDDVKEYLKLIHKRNNTSQRSISDTTSVELTSKIPGSQIPEILNKLEVKYGSDGAEPIDTLLATNMLSVGVDIPRLNSMFVVGQPKLTSEYIQATSRVGRNSPGVVATIYNSTRSRDRSHYETFQAYHQSLYSYVEATSVTPFSKPALKKALASVVVAMLRNTVEKLSGDKSAMDILESKSKLDDVSEFLIKRVVNSEDNYKLYNEDAAQELNSFIEKWESIAMQANNNSEKFNYYLHKSKSSEFEGKLLLKSFDDPNHREATPVMGTMRNVEENSIIEIINGGNIDNHE